MDEELENGFLKFMEVERSASPRTLENYRLALASCRNWFGGGFAGWREATADDFRRWLYDMMKEELAKATIRLRFAAVRSFYKFLVHRRGHAKSPVAEVQLPKPERKLPVVLTVAQTSTDCPHTDGLGVVLTRVVVSAGPTVTANVSTDPLKQGPSPL